MIKTNKQTNKGNIYKKKKTINESKGVNQK